MKLVMKELYRLMGSQLDINEHLGFLRGLASDPEVKEIVEIGFRTGVSATALASAGKVLYCYDIADCMGAVLRLRGTGAKLSFERGDSHKITIPECDLLHIDSKHTYQQLRVELRRHHERVRKWIALHDTATFGTEGQDGSSPGLLRAIMEFLDQEGHEWMVLLHLNNNNGMTLLQRRSSRA